MTSNTREKDIAIATSYFLSYEELNGTFFSCIDKCYDMAVTFVEKYPPETKWGIDLEYEETLYKFYIENF